MYSKTETKREGGEAGCEIGAGQKEEEANVT